MPQETVKFLVVDTEVAADPIENVTLRIFDSNDAFVTSATTNADGMAEVTLEGTDTGTSYTVRLYKFGVSFTTPQKITIYSPPGDPGNNFKFYGDIHAEDAPSDSRLCRCYGHLRYGNGNPFQGRIRFTTLSPDIVDSNGIFGRSFEIEAQSDGYVSVDLFRKGKYIAIIADDTSRTIYIPDKSTIPIADVLYPTVVRVTFYPSPPFELGEGDVLIVAPTIYVSDGRTLDGVGIGDVQWSIKDEHFAGLTIKNDTLEIYGKAVGTTVLQVSRKDESIFRIPEQIEGDGAEIIVI